MIEGHKFPHSIEKEKFISLSHKARARGIPMNLIGRTFRMDRKKYRCALVSVGVPFWTPPRIPKTVATGDTCLKTGGHQRFCCILC